MTGYYDYVLMAIPGIMGLGVGTSAVTSIGTELVMGVATLLTFPILFHAMFVRAPTMDSASTATKNTMKDVAEKTKPVSTATKNTGKNVSNAGKKAVGETKKAVDAGTKPVREAASAGKKAVGETKKVVDEGANLDTQIPSASPTDVNN